LLSATQSRRLRRQLRPAFRERLERLQIDEDSLDAICGAYLPLAAWVRRHKGANGLVLGVNGAQGAGKSTLCEFLTVVLEQGYGQRVASFSIDDLYETRSTRQRLARDVHPLLVTRGVPGTHDVGLGMAVISALRTSPPGVPTLIPSFDKALDDRRPESEWKPFHGPADVVIVEGWCVAARPQTDAELALAVNSLEAEEDSDGSWRRYVNRRLATDYAQLFSQLDKLVMLKVPGMSSVYEWRALQENKLASANAGGKPNRIMDAAELRRFIMHYERLTRAMLQEMPGRADVVLFMDEHHHFSGLQLNG
jgi:D-glycerate 3-kinase